MRYKLNEFKTKLENYFINDKENEWVDIEVINVNRLDIKIVSDKVENLDELQRFINKCIDEVNSLIENTSEKLYLGHLEVNTVEEADFFDITRPTRRKYDKISFANMIDIKNNLAEICEKEESMNSSRIISFYSYKGGVGRTVALIQTAYLLAKSGKKVLLMDLDIEAPSFYNIFKDTIKTKLGLVDYLYEELYLNNEISVKDIITKINLNLKGEIYLISAGINDFKYVKKLDMLKEKRIYENKLIQKLIKESEDSYGIEYTLIDSRTGINRWGALSLIDIADEVILFAYPNRENIEGLKLIIELIEECKKTTIALSRIDQSPQGASIAKKLFKDLNINQEYIPIYYESGIALAEKYPIEEYLKPYKTISDFILEEENNKRTLEYIKGNSENTKEILEQIKKGDFQKTVVSRETKMVENSNWIIIKGEEDSLNIDYIFKNELDDNILISQSSQDEVDKEVKAYIQSVNDFEDKNIVRIVLAYVIKIINDYKEFEEFGLKGIDKLVYKDFKSYIDYIYELQSLEEIYEGFSYKLQSTEEDIYIKVNVILDFEKILAIFKEQVKDEYITEQLLNTTLNIIALINAHSDISLKLILNNKYYEEHINIIDKYNANILNLVWGSLEKEIAICDIKEVLAATIDCIEDVLLKDIYNKLIGGDKYSKDIRMENQFLLDMIEKNFEGIFPMVKIRSKEEFSSVIYGKRINPDVYSKLLSEWIYEELMSIGSLNKRKVFELVSYASEFELNDDNKNKKSIIAFSSFKKAIGKMI